MPIYNMVTKTDPGVQPMKLVLTTTAAVAIGFFLAFTDATRSVHDIYIGAVLLSTMTLGYNLLARRTGTSRDAVKGLIRRDTSTVRRGVEQCSASERS